MVASDLHNQRNMRIDAIQLLEFIYMLDKDRQLQQFPCPTHNQWNHLL
ncbi:hypothetical protein C943_03112 [Mariniradius saccharolyticus AK6]|uniref:Uncharacterized protein n=1 Tax=Mariniradius saccharolyticus AK6 TaxID=1239962 RepID=M7X7D6_9BACT|nr:hypothetical protein C943_03112 [Mariniradius saccharolyticus AK6]